MAHLLRSRQTKEAPSIGAAFRAAISAGQMPGQNEVPTSRAARAIVSHIPGTTRDTFFFLFC